MRRSGKQGWIEMVIAAELPEEIQTHKPVSRFARRKMPAATENTLPGVESAPAEAAAPQDARNLGLSILQFIGLSLDGGPRGIHPPTHIAALAALAGYSAKISVSLNVARGKRPDDFQRVSLSRSRTILTSEQVNMLVLKANCESVAAIMTEHAMRCGLARLPDIDASLHGHLLNRDMFAGLPRQHVPELPCETLLMMYWEPVARFFRSPSGDFDIAPQAAAYAAGEAISAYRTSMPVDTALEVALRAAIAMSKIDRAF